MRICYVNLLKILKVYTSVNLRNHGEGLSEKIEKILSSVLEINKM